MEGRSLRAFEVWERNDWGLAARAVGSPTPDLVPQSFAQ